MRSTDAWVREMAECANDDLLGWYGMEDLFNIACDFSDDVGPEFASAYYSEICSAYPDEPR